MQWQFLKLIQVTFVNSLWLNSQVQTKVGSLFIATNFCHFYCFAIWVSSFQLFAVPNWKAQPKFQSQRICSYFLGTFVPPNGTCSPGLKYSDHRKKCYWGKMLSNLVAKNVFKDTPNMVAFYFNNIIFLRSEVFNLENICQYAEQIDGLVQERCNSIALAVEYCLSCTKPSKCF